MDHHAEQSAWSQGPEPTERMGAIDQDLDDLSNLFEFGDIDLNNIPSVDGAHYDDAPRQPPSTPFDEIADVQAMQTSPTDADFRASYSQFDGSQNVNLLHSAIQFDQPSATSHPYPVDTYPHSIPSHYHPQPSYAFQGRMAYPPSQHVPPTPNSFKMQGESGSFTQHPLDPQQRVMFEQRYPMRGDDMIALTPMASPADTPQFSVSSEYTVPGAYFSPLTSPMLHAENANHLPHQSYYTHPNTAPSSDSTSPLDVSFRGDVVGDAVTPPSATVGPRKSSRRKLPTSRSTARAPPKVKQSPIQKATKRKSGTMLSSLIPSQEMDAVLEAQRSASAQPPSAGLRLPNECSENGSISPEPLNESLMAPPPRPGSRPSRSPALAGQSHERATGTPGTAATPKSLLSSRHPQAPNSAPSAQPESSDGQGEAAAFEELQLPEAADQQHPSGRSRVAPINSKSQIVPSPHGESDVVSSKTPKLGPSSTPGSAHLTSASSSPAGASGVAVSTPGTLLNDPKQGVKSGRSNRQRGSMSSSGSALLSPAIRPRISPSIKPLLPDGASLHSPAHALLLASKSNYQNLLEGNHLPGVNYPDSLSTGLTSKRTSHKVAEQGRRNRINDALKEMQSLLPKAPSNRGSAKDGSLSDGSPEADAEGDGKGDKDDAQMRNHSKAATVESANEYIRKLQKENAALLALKDEHEAMKRKLEAQTASSAMSSPNSDPMELSNSDSSIVRSSSS